MLNEGSVVSGSGCCQRVAQPPPLGTCVSEGPGASPPPLGCQHSCVRVHASSSRSGGNIRQIRQPMCSVMDAWVQGTGSHFSFSN